MKLPQVNIPEKYQLFLWPVMGVGISLGLSALLIIPQVNKISETNNKIEQLKQRTAILEKKASDLSKINIAEYKQDLAELQYAIPSQPDITSSISQIQGLAAQTQTVVTSMSINIPSSASGSDSYQISISIKGDLTSVYSYINKLKSSPRVMAVNSIDFSGDKTGDSFEATISLTTFYQTAQTTLPSIEQPVNLLNDKDKEIIAKISGAITQLPIISETTATGPKGKPNPFE